MDNSEDSLPLQARVFVDAYQLNSLHSGTMVEVDANHLAILMTMQGLLLATATAKPMEPLSHFVVRDIALATAAAHICQDIEPVIQEKCGQTTNEITLSLLDPIHSAYESAQNMAVKIASAPKDNN